MPLTSFDDLLREQLEEDPQVARLYEQECRSLDAAVEVTGDDGPDATGAES